jgi:hypothetical protein
MLPAGLKNRFEGVLTGSTKGWWAIALGVKDAGLAIEYHALARLSDSPDHTMRMSELAEATDASLSRLSHLIKRLESRDLVRRERDPEDGRYTNAILTPAGLGTPHRQCTRPRRQGPRADDRRPQSGRAAPPPYGIGTNPERIAAGAGACRQPRHPV